MLIPVEAVEAGEFELEEGVIDAEDDVGHNHHQRQVQHYHRLEPHNNAEGIHHCQRTDENAQLRYYHRHCEQYEEDGQDGVNHRFDLAVPEPLGLVDELILGLDDEGGVDPLAGVVDVGHYVFNQEGLEGQLLPPAFQSG